ncbi:MAG: ATP-binding cassette domain-containing protein [Calditrichaceae bacterium]|nr:ATP-binding cassette domain-containing protein [Calditrichia bacterium]NUQ42210.1 ATP-binding cassette domain-containing protein [Calditrichaceae bacterium]
MIRFKDVTLTLGERKVLDNVSFTIETGELILLVGGSGSGKSTILKLILGLARPEKGEIYINGQEIASMRERRLLKVRRDCGIVFQEGALFDSLTVEENVGFFLKENLNMPEEEVHKQVVEELAFLGLEDFLHYYPSQLSGGMKKRVAVARAAIANPRIMLYDEPTAGLDPIAAQRVVDLISDLHRQLNITSVVVTHEIHFFLNKVKRLMMLKDGRIVYDGAPVADIHEWYEDPHFKGAQN